MTFFCMVLSVTVASTNTKISYFFFKNIFLFSHRGLNICKGFSPYISSERSFSQRLASVTTFTDLTCWGLPSLCVFFLKAS